jgi:methionyl-tRNA formyltransferase
MDAGRIASQKWLQLDKDETSDVALLKLFELGSDMLLENLPQLLNGTGYEASTEQDHTKATQAPKLSKQEGILQLHKMTATECHDIACALNVWPGTSVKFTCFTPITREIKKKEIDDGLHTSTGREFILKEECFTIKVSETSVEESLDEWDSDKVPLEVGKAQMYKGRKATDMLIVCKDNTLLRVGQMQLPGKKPIQPRAFFNGRKGAKLLAKEKEKKVIAPA